MATSGLRQSRPDIVSWLGICQVIADDYMPSTEVVAELQGSIDAYNARRPEVERQARWRVLSHVGGTALAFLAIVTAVLVLVPGAEIFSTWAFIVGVVAVAFMFGAYTIAMMPAKSFQQKLRSTLFTRLFPFVETVSYVHGQQPVSFARVPVEATGRFNRQHFDDVISGGYEGFPFELYEVTLRHKAGKSTSTVFRGVIVAFHAPRAFPGTLLATKAVGGVTLFFRKLFGDGGLERVTSGNPALDEAYEFRSDALEAARPLVNGDFASALDWMREAWPGEPARVALRGDDVFLLLPMGRDCFELPGIGMPLDYEAHVKPIAAELAAMTATAALVRKAIA